MRTTDILTAKRIATAPDELVIVLADREVRLPWQRCSDKLARATAEQRQQAELSPGGYGIHWAAIDEDLSIGGLVRLSEADRQ